MYKHIIKKKMKTSKIARIRCLAIMILVIIANNTLQASNKAQDSICRNCVVEFYKEFHNDTNRMCEPENKTDLCGQLSLEDINEIIRKAPIFNDGGWMHSFVEVKLSDKQTIYFQVSTTPPAEVDCVWLSDGTALSNYSDEKVYFIRPAIINDSDRYTNIRKQPNANSKIVRRILKNELFFFTPTSKSDWYRVYSSLLSPCIGYIHKSKITVYDNFPESIKKNVRKIRYPEPKHNNVLQVSSQEQTFTCRDCVARFYKTVYPSNKFYIERECYNINNYRSEIIDTLSLKALNEIIRKAPVSRDGLWMDSLVEIKLSDKKTIYFQIYLDQPSSIDHIWLSDGIDFLSDKEYKEYFRRPGIINDTDGYTNIREQPNAKSKIVRRILKNELFFFMPVSDSDWYRVYSNESSSSIGYIHKNKITTYDNFPEKIKRKVRKMRSGC